MSSSCITELKEASFRDSEGRNNAEKEYRLLDILKSPHNN